MRKIVIIINFCVLFFPISISAQDGGVRIYTDTAAINYFKGGVMQNGKLHLTPEGPYNNLDKAQKREVLQVFVPEFGNKGFVVHAGNLKELWMLDPQGRLQLVDTWNMDDPELQKFTPISLEKSGSSRLFWYAGGALNGTKGNFTGTINLRAGTYLYKNLIDCSVLANLGVLSSDASTDFTGDIGLMGRAYIPMKKQKTPIAPYGGLGVTLNYTQETYVELVFYAGVSIFVGPGSLDVGAQYGIKSKFALTIGYTFRPRIGEKKR